jgi:hypothetical protein
MTAQLSITDIDNTLKIRDIFLAIPEQMITEMISFINPDVAQTYTEILRLNETMPNIQRCVLATACGSSDDGFKQAYKEYNPNSVYIINPTWHNLCQITALKKVSELLFVPTNKLTVNTCEYYHAKHRLEMLSSGIEEDGIRFTGVSFATLPEEYKNYVGYVIRTNTILSFIIGGRFKYEWRTTRHPRIGRDPYFFYIMAKRKNTVFMKRIAEHQYKNGIITDKRYPVTDKYIVYDIIEHLRSYFNT